MAGQNGTDSVHAELEEILEMFKYALVQDEPVARVNALHLHFDTMRKAHANGELDDADLSGHLHDWKRGVKGLLLVSAEDALDVATNALEACQKNEQMPVADKLIVNTVCGLITTCVRPAMNANVKRLGFFNMERSAPYIDHLKNVLYTTAPHFDSASFQLTFMEAMSEFKKTILGHFVPPASRYHHVKQVHDWAEKQQPRCGAVLGYMKEILFYTTHLPNGQEIILHPREAWADMMGQAHYIAESNEAILEFIKEDLQRAKQAKTPTILSFAKASVARAEELAAQRLPQQKIEPSEPCSP